HGAVVAYEWALRAGIGWLIEHRRQPHVAFRFLNALVETSIPTALLYMAVSFLGPRDALGSPAFLLYFFCILLSILQFDPPLCLGGELRSVGVMFLDIRNFSSYAAGERPEAVMAYLNTLFDFMIDIVNEHQGIVNKFLGDGFMAVFGAPVEDAERCAHAVGASLEILERLDRLNAAGKIRPTRVGIGLHMGEAVTGNVGSADRKEYTIIGDVVN